jgi:hypothetical protein
MIQMEKYAYVGLKTHGGDLNDRPIARQVTGKLRNPKGGKSSKEV